MTEAQAVLNELMTQNTATDAAPSQFLTAEQALALYYQGRLAYDSRDNRRPIGRYTQTGSVVPFGSHHNTVTGE